MLLNNGSGVFTALGAPLATANNPYAVTVGDLDGDGDLDIATSNSGNSSISVFRNDGSGAFTPASGSPFAVGVSPGGVVMGDFDEDGDLDLSTANFGSSTTSILINTAALYSVVFTHPTLEGTPPGAGGDLVFTVSRTATSEAEDVAYTLGGTATAGSDYTVPSGTVSFAIGQATAEIHISVTPDATIESNESVSVTLAAASGDGFINPNAATALGTIVNDDGRTMDFNGDGKSDVFWQNSDGRTAIWTMDGTSITAGAYLPDVGPGWDAARAGDFNGDGKSDVFWHNSDGRTAIWTMDGTSITAGTYLPDVGPGWHATAAADFNGDGKSDVFWHNSDGRTAIWTMDGTTITAGAYLPDVGPGWDAARAGDFNGDGKSDVFWHNSDGRTAIWTMDGTTITAGTYLPDVGPGWHAAAAADFNGDGKSDVFWQNSDGRTAIWTMDGTTITGRKTGKRGCAKIDVSY